jgi:hypothetical protein
MSPVTLSDDVIIYYRLWGHPLNKFDPKLNLDSLQQCLVKLLRMDQASLGLKLEEMAELESYYVLANLGKALHGVWVMGL